MAVARIPFHVTAPWWTRNSPVAVGVDTASLDMQIETRFTFEVFVFEPSLEKLQPCLTLEVQVEALLR